MTVVRPSAADQLTADLDRASALAHEDPAAAEVLVRTCADTAAGLGRPASEAQAMYLLARLDAERGELGAALELVARARQLWLSADERIPALRTDLGRMQILDDLGNHAEAVAVGEALLTALDDTDVATPDEAAVREGIRGDALGNVGVAYSFLGEHERALDAYARSEEIYVALGRTADTAKPQANRGIELLALGRPREALRALGSAERTFAAAGDRIWSAKCAGHLGQAHLRMGQLREALAVLEPAAATLQELGVTAEASRLELTIASVHLAAGLYAESAARARAVMQRTHDAGMKHDRAFATLTLALAESGSGRWTRASAALDEASALFAEVGDRQYAAQVLLAAAEVAVRRGAADAFGAARAAVSVLAEGGWLIPLARAHLTAADAAPDDATCEEHLDAAAPLIAELGLPSLRFRAALGRGRLRRRQGALDEAAALLDEAVRTAEQMGTALPDPILQTAFRTDKAPAYDELIDLLVARNATGDVPRAAALSDLAKARTLIDLIGRGAGTPAASRRADAADTAELDECQVDLSAVYAALADEGGASRRALLWQRAASLEQRIVALRTRSAALAPRPGRIVDVAPGTPTGAGAAHPVLRYHVAGPDVLAFVRVGTSDRVHRLTGAVAEVERALEALSAQWQRFGLGAQFARRNAAALEQTTHAILRSLYDVLLAPIRPWLDDADATELTVVPHRRLGEVPFHALHDGARNVVDAWAITIVPTALPVASRQRAAAGRGAPLVIAVPDPTAPAIEIEARALAAALPGADLVVGADATTARLPDLVAGRSLVHLACHGVYRESNPLFSALRFADRWLTSAEVLDLDLSGALVVLSACESGRPGGAGAEPVGLTWAFLAAGAAGAIASQWLVDDAVAAEFAQLVHAHLAADRPPAEAVRSAQLAVRERYPHPYHWAPFGYVSAPVPRGAQP